MKKKQKTALILMFVGIILIPSGYEITTYNKSQIVPTVEETARKVKSFNLTANFHVGDDIFVKFVPPPSPGGWELGCEGPTIDPYYGYIPYDHVFVYADLYNPNDTLVSRLEFVFIYAPEVTHTHNLYLFNFSHVILTNETGPFPREPVTEIEPHWFNFSEAQWNGAYRARVWAGGVNKSPHYIALGKQFQKIEYPYSYCLPLGVGVSGVGIILTGYGMRVNWKMKRRPLRREKNLEGKRKKRE